MFGGRRLAAEGLLVGGSTGTVLSAVCRWSARIPEKSCVIALSPDMGDRYLESIYDDAWVEVHFPGLLASCKGRAAAPLFWERRYVGSRAA